MAMPSTVVMARKGRVRFCGLRVGVEVDCMALFYDSTFEGDRMQGEFYSFCKSKYSILIHAIFVFHLDSLASPHYDEIRLEQT